MKLVSFRVQNYRSIVDSGWVTVADSLTAFIGLSGTGKTNILRALSLLNPIGDRTAKLLEKTEYNHIEDSSRSREIFSKVDSAGNIDDRPDPTVISATFSFDTWKEMRSFIECNEEPVGYSPNKDEFNPGKITFTVTKTIYPNPNSLTLINFESQVLGMELCYRPFLAEFWYPKHSPIFNLITDHNPDFKKELHHNFSSNEANKGIEEREQALNKEKEWLKGTDKLRAGSDQGYYNDIINNEIALKKKVRYYQNPLPSESLIASGIRSLDALNYKIYRTGQPESAIILLDEPEIHKDPGLQKKLMKDLRESGKQCLFTTHSPFCVDELYTTDVRVVTMTDDQTIVYNDISDLALHDKNGLDSLYPAYHCLGLSMSEGLAHSNCDLVIIEGESDRIILESVRKYLRKILALRKSRPIKFVNGDGCASVKPLVQIYISILEREDMPLVLVDSDEAGKKTALDLRNGHYQEEKYKVKTIGDFIGGGKEYTISDIIPAQWVIDAFNEVTASEIKITDIEQGLPIEGQLEQLEPEKTSTNEWKIKVAGKIAEKITTEEPNVDYLKIWVKIFKWIQEGGEEPKETSAAKQKECEEVS